MADIKISGLPAASGANATDQLEANQAGTSRRVTLAQVLAYIQGAISVAWGSITGKPTTLSGYGITDAASAAQLTSEANTRAADDTTLAGALSTHAGTGPQGAHGITAAGAALASAANAAAQRTALALVPGTDVQVYDVDLAAIAGLTSAADKLPYFTGAGTAALTDLSAAGRALIDDANVAAQRVTLGLVLGTDVQAYDADLAAIAALTSAADRLPYFTGSGAAALATFTAAGRAILDDADAAAQRATLGVIPAPIQPADAGFVGWTMDPVVAGSTLQITAGQIWIHRVVAAVSTTVNNIVTDIQASGSGLTANQCLAALYDASGTRLGVTGDQATAWQSTGIKTMALTAGAAVTAGSVYYIAFLANGTTMPTFRRAVSATTVSNFGMTVAAPRFANSSAGNTSLPSSITISSFSLGSNSLLAAMSA